MRTLAAVFDWKSAVVETWTILDQGQVLRSTLYSTDYLTLEGSKSEHVTKAKRRITD